MDTKSGKRRIHPSSEFCNDCIKIKYLFDNPDIVAKRNQHKEKILENKKKLKNFIENYAKNFYIKIGKEQNQKKTRLEYRIISSAYRARLRKASEGLSNEECTLVKEFYRNCPDGYHVDHIIPISKGGKHCVENLQYLLPEQNWKKNKSIEIEILKKLNDQQPISIAFLQRKFKLNYEDAMKIMEEIDKL